MKDIEDLLKIGIKPTEELNTVERTEVIKKLAMLMSNNINTFKYSENEKIFKHVFKTLNQALPNGIVKGKGNTPLNLFEAVSVGAALAYIRKSRINTTGIDKWITDKQLIKYISGATNSKPKVSGRIEFCQKKFEA